MKESMCQPMLWGPRMGPWPQEIAAWHCLGREKGEGGREWTFGWLGGVVRTPICGGVAYEEPRVG